MAKGKKKESESIEVSKLKEELAETKEAFLRMAADYANLEKRIQEERIATRSLAKVEILEKLFPIMDNLYRASLHAPKISPDQDVSQLSKEDFKKIANYFEGLRLIEQQLEATLAAAGLKRIPTKDQPFNHNLHEAISYESSKDVPAEHIIEEVESGWQIDDKVVRPAKVRVSRG